MSSGWLFLGASMLISVGAFLNGLRFSRMSANPWAGKKMFGQPIEGHDLDLKSVRRIGVVQMVAAPLFLLLVAALSFGLFGPVEGIETIHLGE